MIAVTMLKLLVGVFVIAVAAVIILIVSMILEYRRERAASDKELQTTD
jgi:hypothetical protein